MTADIEPLRCEAIITWVRGDFRWTPVYCRQTVGVRGYWEAGARARTNTDHFVAYCPIPGHKANCERRYLPEVTAEQFDEVTAAKAEAYR